MVEVKHIARENLHNKLTTLLPDKRILTLIAIICASFASVACAQMVFLEMPPIRPEPSGSGARALGQSAFIAVADDATAASWNPAGLINLEQPEASFVGVWRSVEEDYSMANPLASSSPESWNDSQINFMSYALPLLVGNTDVVISINYHQVYNCGEEYNSFETIDKPPTYTVKQVSRKSEGAVSAYSLAGGLSIPVYPEIAVGASFNWYTQSLFNDYAWQRVTTAKTTTSYPPFPDFVTQVTQTETSDDFRGHNFTFGLLWDVYEEYGNLLTLGLVYHTPFTAKADQEIVSSTQTTTSSLRTDMDIDFPASLGVGANYRISESLSVAFDVEWKEWSKFRQKYADGKRISPFDDDTLACRLGFEHLKLPQITDQAVFAFRSGAFYEPRPASEKILPVYGLSTGFGWTVMDRFSLDFAYQYRWGDQDFRTADYDFNEYSIQEHVFVASLVLYL